LHVLLCNLPALAFTLPLVLWLTNVMDFNQRGEAMLAWLLSTCVYMVVYLLCVRVFRLLDGKDLDMLGAYVPLIRHLAYVKDKA